MLSPPPKVSISTKPRSDNTTEINASTSNHGLLDHKSRQRTISGNFPNPQAGQFLRPMQSKSEELIVRDELDAKSSRKNKLRKERKHTPVVFSFCALLACYSRSEVPTAMDEPSVMSTESGTTLGFRVWPILFHGAERLFGAVRFVLVDGCSSRSLFIVKAATCQCPAGLMIYLFADSDQPRSMTIARICLVNGVVIYAMCAIVTFWMLVNQQEHEYKLHDADMSHLSKLLNNLYLSLMLEVMMIIYDTNRDNRKTTLMSTAAAMPVGYYLGAYTSTYASIEVSNLQFPIGGKQVGQDWLSLTSYRWLQLVSAGIFIGLVRTGVKWNFVQLRKQGLQQSKYVDCRHAEQCTSTWYTIARKQLRLLFNLLVELVSLTFSSIFHNLKDVPLRDHIGVSSEAGTNTGKMTTINVPVLKHLRFNSADERTQFVDALPDIQRRIEGFVNDYRFRAMRGVQNQVLGIKVFLTAEKQLTCEHFDLDIKISFEVHLENQVGPDLADKCDLPGAADMFFAELAKRAGK